MDLNLISGFIQQVGFPIVACGACFWMINKQDERHKEEISKLGVSLDNNTKAISTLVERLGGGDSEK